MLAAVAIFAISGCEPDIPWNPGTDITDPDTPDGPDTPTDPTDPTTPTDPATPTDPTTPDEPQSGEVVDGKGDETLYTGVSAWTGTKATDSASAAVHGTSEDIYWENNSWNDVVTVVYDGTKATITKTNAKILTYSTGAHVTVDMQTNSNSNVVIIVKGKSSDGSLKVYGEKKFKLTMCGLDLTSTIGPAINIQNHKRCFVHLVAGGTNRVTDAATYSNDKYYLGTATADTEDRKGAFFSEGNVILSGAGYLVVNGKYKHGFCTDGYLYMRQGPTLAVESAANNCVHLKGDDDDQFGLTGDGGCIYAKAAATAGKGIKSDMNIIIKGGLYEISTSGGATYDSTTKDVSSACCIKTDGDLSLLGGSFTLKSTGTAGKCLKAGSDDVAGKNIVIGTTTGGPTITASTSGSSYSASTKAGGGFGGGGFPGGPGGGGTTSGASSKAKAVKASGTFTMYGGEMNITTAGSEAEGIETKANSTNSMVFKGGKCYVKAYDDALNSAGQMVFSGGYVYAYSTGNDAIDSNYGRSGAISISDGVVIAHSKASPEEAFDCDNHSYISITGGTVFGTGGTQGGGSSSPGHSVPIIYRSSTLSVSTGYFVVTDSSGNVLFSAYVPRSVSSTSTIICSPKFKSGTTYKYGMVSSVPTGGSSLWGTFYYEGGTASVSNSGSAS